MIEKLSIWAFLNFIYLKIAYQLGFNEGITIFADFLICISFFVLNLSLSKKLDIVLSDMVDKENNSETILFKSIKKTAYVFLSGCVIYALLSRGIVYGFSENLNDRISSDYKAFERFIMFYSFLIFPFLLYWLTYICMKLRRPSFIFNPNHRYNNEQIRSLLASVKQAVSKKFIKVDSASLAFYILCSFLLGLLIFSVIIEDKNESELTLKGNVYSIPMDEYIRRNNYDIVPDIPEKSQSEKSEPIQLKPMFNMDELITPPEVKEGAGGALYRLKSSDTAPLLYSPQLDRMVNPKCPLEDMGGTIRNQIGFDCVGM